MYLDLHIAKAERELKDAEIRLKNVKSSMDAIEKEIDTLSTIEIQLIENIRCLKKQRVIALAHEFRKAKEDLDKTQNRLTMLRNDRERHRLSFSRAQSVVEKCISDYNGWFNKQFENNVIQLEFGKNKI